MMCYLQFNLETLRMKGSEEVEQNRNIELKIGKRNLT